MIESAKPNGTLADKANAAFEQVAVKVIQRAKQTGTPVIVWENDQIKEVPADELPDHAKLKTKA